ncbi:MAG: DNA polymerase III subunit gamma/tau [Patescibacteria group bacterium]|nr:DNA polymerase III subunit gamma/tau [Patescibacteria group bacterium]
MALALYRKYRPQTFSEVIGQEHVKKTLENEIKMGKISHAYLFYGPRGIGKTTLGRIFAKAINCQNRKEGQSEPCNQCFSCQEIIAGKSLDFIEIDAASNRGINEIKELRESVRFPPAVGKYKIFIIDESHQITPDAFNALLKTLEEPPSYVVFILVTTEIHKMPFTIVSRCQKFNFSKVSLPEILERLKKIVKLEGVKVEEKVLKNIARQSQGFVRDAESLLAQVLSLGDKEITSAEAEIILPRSDLEKVSQLAEYLFKKDLHRAIDLINQLLEEGIDLKQFNLDLIEFLRKMLLIKIGFNPEKYSFSLDEKIEEKILVLAKETSINYLVKMIEELIKVKVSLEYAEIPQLPLELATIKICSLGSAGVVN